MDKLDIKLRYISQMCFRNFRIFLFNFLFPFMVYGKIYVHILLFFFCCFLTFLSIAKYHNNISLKHTINDYCYAIIRNIPFFTYIFYFICFNSHAFFLFFCVLMLLLDLRRLIFIHHKRMYEEMWQRLSHIIIHHKNPHL